ncbi:MULTISPECIES: hypothetical protein [unclassified Saccharibacter]|uniref:hypothetical protein n=1 Tax=unclassified Saccharibacter TaxID=2648722 RepID=UPI00132A02F5|nr:MULTISPECIES: hypothetical protein [unclassified Saccharibacter]MXV35755.1 hypothetical protein [Saccharibacter sp. EH611]MXV57904.1 hypothetical protein [Saccharibacter sp. EH70]MXV66299.1 hypothetical protein [Saccharibacter sp. EH60]
MSKKYELLTDDTVTDFGETLFRIKALRDIPEFDVSKGELGGYIACEDNLSHQGNAWVSGDAWVFDDAAVSDDAKVSGNAQVFGDAKVFGNARVSGNAWIPSQRHILTIGPIGSEDGALILFHTKDVPYVTRGCFSGTLDEFEKAVNDTHGDNKHGQEYRAVIALARLRAREWEAA